MDIIIFFKLLFGEINLLELIAIIIFTTIVIFIFIKLDFIKRLFSWSGFGIAFAIFSFSTIIVKSGFLLLKNNFDEYNINTNLTTNLISKKSIEKAENSVKTETKGSNLDNGVLVTDLPPNRKLNNLKYSELDVKNSLNKIIDDYGYEVIPYLQRIVLGAKKFEGSKEAIYMKLEDYAFLCSMNLCDKYFYDFNDIKNKKDEFFLVLVIPEFISVLEKYNSE